MNTANPDSRAPPYETISSCCTWIFFNTAYAGYSGTLTTPTYIVKIDVHCEEGVVVCDDVSFQGTNLKTGTRIELHGKTLHAWCTDGVTPCQFIGYQFEDKDCYYQVVDGADGRLLIMRGKQILVDEKGAWK